MSELHIVGIDLAKRVFHLHGADLAGNVLFRKKLTRPQFEAFLGDLSNCIIAMEACGSAHHWGRVASQNGHDVRLIPVQHVKPFVQGRGKIERLFGTINTELLADLPGRLVGGRPVTAPKLTLSDLDAAIRTFVVGRHNVRLHPAIGTTPHVAWVAEGWLPRMPERLEELDELLVMVARPRVVGRDGIRFGGLRYLDPTLAAFVGERVTIRHDPRDVAEIRVFHRDRFLCRAINAEHTDQTVSLRDVQAARKVQRQTLRVGIKERIAAVPVAPTILPKIIPPSPKRRHPRLKVYRED